MEVDDIEVETQTGKKIIHFILGLILEFRIYYSFPCLISTSSKLDTVFLPCSVKASDVKSYGSNECFITLINTLKKKMEVDDIEVETKTGKKTNHFILGLILGDNLGLNTMLNFSKSFSANYYYRFCEMKKELHVLFSTSSKLDTVFLAYTVKALDVKSHGSNECFITLINTLKKMEVDDIEVKTKTGKKINHFILGLILEYIIVFHVYLLLPQS